MFAHITIEPQSIEGFRFEKQVLYAKITGVTEAFLGAKIVRLDSNIDIDVDLSISMKFIEIFFWKEEIELVFNLYKESSLSKELVMKEGFKFKGFLTDYQLIELISKDLDY